MYLAQVTRYDIIHVRHQSARRGHVFRPSKVHMRVTKHLLRYQVGTTEFPAVEGSFKPTAYSDTTWGNNPDKGTSMSSISYHNVEIYREIEV